MHADPKHPSPPAPVDPGRRSRPVLSASQELPGASRGATGLLFPNDVDARRDSARTAVALVLLVGLVFLLLNVFIYHSARSRLVNERWDQLVACTEEKRLDLSDLLDGLKRDAQFIAAHREIRTWVTKPGAAPGPNRTPERALDFERELDQAAASFGLLGIEVVGLDGKVLANSSTASLWRTPEAMALARRVSEDPATTSVMDHSLANGKPMVLVAAPVRVEGGGGIEAVTLLYAGLEDRLRPTLKDWIIDSPTAGVYLVVRDGDDAMIASQPPQATGLYLGQRVPIHASHDRILALAAQGGQGELETRDATGPAVWSVTRPLPELGCGIVGQVDRATMLAGMRSTLLGLLLLDVGVVLLGLAVVLLWRRQFRAQVAERETAITRRHADRLQAVLDSAFDAILSLDANGTVVTVNTAAERLFGRPARELTGRPMGGLLVWGGGGPLPGVGSEPGATSRSIARRPDGGDVAVEYTLARSQVDAAALYTLVVRDVSERVKAEEKVQAFAQGLEVSNRRLEDVNRQLEQASRLKSEFLANTSHELRTPLNGIMGFLQLVQDGLCDSREEEHEFLQQALQCSKHLLGLINDVLDIAKIEAGRLTLQIEPVDVGALFDEVYTVTHVQAQQKGLRLVFEPPPPGSLPARGDFGKAKQVLINLIGNSLKFTPSGSITVRAIPNENAGHLLIEVIDTGIGIPLDRQGLIFEKFIQADGSTTRRYGGTGLGLAITRSLVELMGGVIDVESPGPGKGTRMFFSLPVWRGEDDLLAPSNTGESPLPDVIQGPPGGPLVLVVDDDPVYRRMVTALLHQHGYRSAEASHAEAGWVLVRRLRPALVVLDYALSCPEGALLRTGWDLAERMSGDERTRNIPFLFVTGFERQLRERLDGMTFTRQPLHLAKPVRGEALLESVVTALGDAPDRMLRVLLADDDPMVAAYVTKVLPADRFQVEVVNNGEECLHLLRTQPKGFDLLLLDLMMPETSGFDVLREMALRGTAAAMSVIVLTAYSDVHSEEERRLLEHGVVLEVLSKTQIHERPGRLTEAIEGHLGALPALAHVAQPAPRDDGQRRAA